MSFDREQMVFMGGTPLVSVIVPVYKVEKYIHRCVDSILAQTYMNLEIILVDDGSPDCCGEICDEYAAKDGRIRVIHQENRGVSAARNAGLDICTGEFITFVDSDDYLECDMLWQLLRGIGDADLCGSGTIRENCDGSIVAVIKPETRYSLSGLTVLRQHYSGVNGTKGITEVAVWGKLYRRDLLCQNRFKEGLLFEDIHLMPYLLIECNTTCYLPYAGYHYVVTPNSITTSMDENHQKRCYEDCFRIWEEHEVLYQQSGLNDLMSEVACARMDKLITHMLRNKVPDGCQGWSRKLLYKTAVRLLTKPIGKARKLRYVAFCLLGKIGYNTLRNGGRCS